MADKVDSEPWPRRPEADWLRAAARPQASRPRFGNLRTAARAGLHPRVVSVHSRRSRRGMTESSVLGVAVDLPDHDAQVELHVAVGERTMRDTTADDVLLMLAGTQTLSDGYLELRSDDIRVVLRIDEAAAGYIARRVERLGPTTPDAKLRTDTLTQLLLNSEVIEAEPLSPEGYTNDPESGLFLPEHLAPMLGTRTDVPVARDAPIVLNDLLVNPAVETALELRTEADAVISVSPARTTGQRTPLNSQRGPGPAWATLCFWLAVVGAGLFRYLVLASGGAPATIDSGNWLAFAESLFGGGSRADSIAYPPLVPALTAGLVQLFGTLHGVAVMGAISSLVPALGLYGALRMSGLGRERIVPALFLLGAGSIGEAAAWGGFPQLIAMGVLPLAVVAGMRAFDEPSRRNGLLLGVLLMVSLATSHFVSVILVLALAFLLVSAAVRHRSRAWVEGMGMQLPTIVIPSVWLAPTYLRLVEAVVVSPNEFAALDNLTPENSLSRLDSVYSDFPALWQVLVPLAVITPLLAWSMRRTPIWRVSTVLLAAVGVLLVATQEARYLYMVPLLATVALAVWLAQVAASPGWYGSDRRTVMIRVGAIALANLLGALQLHAGLAGFERQRDFYGVLSPGLVSAIEAADLRAGPDDVIAVPSLDDAPIGWWVEGTTDASVLYGTPLRWLNFSDEIERAKVANAVFDPSFPGENTLPLLEAASVDVVIVPRTWAWFDDEAVDAWVADNGLEVLERNVDAIAIALPGSVG